MAAAMMDADYACVTRRFLGRHQRKFTSIKNSARLLALADCAPNTAPFVIDLPSFRWQCARNAERSMRGG